MKGDIGMANYEPVPIFWCLSAPSLISSVSQRSVYAYKNARYVARN